MSLIFMRKVAMYIGLDVGKVNDPAAIAVLERTVTFNPGPHVPSNPESGATLMRYSVRHLERLRLGTAYPAVVDRMAVIAERLRQHCDTTELVVDVTGVGRPVFDLLADRGLGVQLVGVNFTGGQHANSSNGRIWNVPKRDLVAGLVVMFQSHELLISDGLAEAPVLVKELVNFRQFISVQGNASYGNDGKVSDHDDYVSACALAAWRAKLRTPKGLGERSLLPLF